MNFKGHLLVGIITFLIVSYFFKLHNVTITQYIFLLGLTVFFALLPDVDTDISKINDFIEITLLSFAIYSFYQYSLSQTLELFNCGIFALLILLASKFLKHRGWMHTIRAGIFLSLPLYLFDPTFAYYAFAGYLSHLIVDRQIKF